MCRAPSSAAAASGDVLADEPGGRVGGHQRRVGQQLIGQRLQPGFPGDLRFGPPLGFVRKVDVLHTGLGVGGHQCGRQLVGELALLLDRRQHRGAAVVELTQVPQAFLEGAQLPVVEAAGDLLAVAGDERDGRALVEQPHRRGDLALSHRQFLSETGVHRFHGARFHALDPTECR